MPAVSTSHTGWRGAAANCSWPTRTESGACPVPAQRPELVTRQGVFGADSGHNNRPIAIDPRTGALFAGVGSMGNIAVEPEPKATIQRFGPDGANQTTYAAGARNPTTLAFHPQTGELWAGVQERDGLGDNLPVRLPDPGTAGRVLRLALCLYRPASAARLCRARARQGRGDDRARSVVPGAFVAARPGISTTRRSFRRNTGAALSPR